MTERLAATIKAELDEAQVAMREARDRIEALKVELELAQVREAAHPWIGRKVRSMRRKSSWGPGVVEKVGVVGVYDPREHGRMRGSYGFNAGDVLVFSTSGKSAVRLHEFRHAGETEWSLIEESKS